MLQCVDDTDYCLTWFLLEILSLATCRCWPPWTSKTVWVPSFHWFVHAIRKWIWKWGSNAIMFATHAWIVGTHAINHATGKGTIQIVTKRLWSHCLVAMNDLASVARENVQQRNWSVPSWWSSDMMCASMLILESVGTRRRNVRPRWWCVVTCVERKARFNAISRRIVQRISDAVSLARGRWAVTLTMLVEVFFWQGVLLNPNWKALWIPRAGTTLNLVFFPQWTSPFYMDQRSLPRSPCMQVAMPRWLRKGPGRLRAMRLGILVNVTASMRQFENVMIWLDLFDIIPNDYPTVARFMMGDAGQIAYWICMRRGRGWRSRSWRKSKRPLGPGRRDSWHWWRMESIRELKC